MKTTSATESEIEREGVRAILIKVGMDPAKPYAKVAKRNTKTGEWIYTWVQDDGSTQAG